MKFQVVIGFMLLVAVVGLPVRAQESGDVCQPVVAEAITQTVQACAETGRDQVCYGHKSLTAEARDGAKIQFAAPGDTADAAAVKTLRLQAMNPAAQQWGIALARISATRPTDAVTLLLFGNVELTNTGLPLALVTLPARVKMRTGANIRSLPLPDAELVTAAALGQAMTAIGRTVDSAWLWVRLDDERLGWVAAELMVVEGDTTLLTEFDPAEPAALETRYGPLQAFNFRSGTDDQPCASAPASGILVQTPTIEAAISLQVNGALVVMQPAATVFLQAQPEELVVQVLEGTAEIVAVGETRTVEAGSLVRVPLVDLAVGETVPRLPEPYIYAEVRTLPVMALPREFEIPLSMGGVVIPGQREVDPLTTVEADDPCTVAAFAEARLRSGPGTNYPVQALMQPGDSAHPDGRAGGADGALWWRLTPDFWVRADAVLFAGTCNDLPIVETPPVPAKR